MRASCSSPVSSVRGTNIRLGLSMNGTEFTGTTSTTPLGRGEDRPHDRKLIEVLGDVPSAIGIGIPGVIQTRRVLEGPNLPAGTLVRHRRRVPRPFRRACCARQRRQRRPAGGVARGRRGRRRRRLGVWLGTGIGGGCSSTSTSLPRIAWLGRRDRPCHHPPRRRAVHLQPARLIEASAGRRSLAASSRRWSTRADTSLFDFQCDEHKSNLTSKVWARALDERDELAVELFDMAIEVVAGGIGSVINLVDVALVVIGAAWRRSSVEPRRSNRPAARPPMDPGSSPKLNFVVAG